MGLAIETAVSTGAGLVGMGIDAITQKNREKRSMKNQMALNQQAKDLALQQWKDTNYSAQMDEMKKAGLNPGLMYGMGGGGGTTASTGSGGSAPAPMKSPMDITSAMQLALMKAQKENIEADTDNKRADIPVKGADVPLKGAQQKGIEAGIPKAQAETKGQEIQNKYAEEINLNTIENVKQEIARKKAEIENLGYKNNVSKATVQTQIRQAELETAGKAIQNALGIAQKNNTIQMTEESKNRIEQKWREIQQTDVGQDINTRKNKIEQFKAELKAEYPTLGEGIGRIINETIQYLNQGSESYSNKVDKPDW